MHAPTVVASLLLACGASVAIAWLARPAQQAPAPAPSTAADEHELVSLRAEVAALVQRLDELSRAPGATAPTMQRVEVPELSSEQVATAVEAYLKQRAAAGGAAAAEVGDGHVDIDAVFASLVGTNFWENGEAWKKAHSEGRMQELIERFEAEAKANPNDIDKQMALANAYISWLQMDQTKWQLSMKADEVWDHVLELDERHWDARFTKAVSYTFYPDFLGKKKDAISHFEVLVEQQESMPVSPHEYQTYLYLGNLLEEKEPERAREIWERGLRRHPNNEQLRQKLGR
jgi:tetratricopeptide (TPR) repeat protein